LRLKTKSTKTNTTKKKRTKRQKRPYKLPKIKEKFLKICTKASRRSKRQKKKCRLIRLRLYRNRLPKIVGRWSSFTPTATSKLKLSLFPISCSARCKSKTNKSCLTLWSVKITSFCTHGVVKCGLCPQTLEIEWRTCVDCSSSSQI
jgi:cysteine sulfinate desulfinase/cysteine desulfurase-like protein